MKKNFLVLSLVGAVCVGLISFTPALAASAPKAFVYKGDGACDDGCYQAAYQMALKAGFDPVYVGPKDSPSFTGVSLWLQPGGKSTKVLNAMTNKLKSALTDFVQQGGAYVGFCAGAFSATKMVGTSKTRGFNIFPGKTVLYDDPYQADIIPTQWNGKLRHVYWEGGPYITEIPAGKAEATAFYPNGQIAAARSTFGKGRVYITGMHPEAPQDWRDYYHLNDADGDDSDLAVEMIDWAVKR